MVMNDVRIVVRKMRTNKIAWPYCSSARSHSDSSSRPDAMGKNDELPTQRGYDGNSRAKTSSLYSAIATTNAKLVMAYMMRGIHGRIRLEIRSPRGRVYEG